MNKELIHNRFAKRLESYNKNAKIQKLMAENLFNFIQNKSPKSILEIGCGTGFLTRVVNDSLKFETYTAVDIVEDCKSFIKEINPQIKFISEDIENLLNNEDKFDLIISNASLQWVNNFKNVIYKLQKRLNPNGELVFSTFGKENFREIYHLSGATLTYYSVNELQKMFSEFSTQIEEEIRVMAFSEPKDVLKHLKSTGVNAIENISWTKKDLVEFENGYNNLCSGRPTLTYNPVYIRIISPVG